MYQFKLVFFDAATNALIGQLAQNPAGGVSYTYLYAWIAENYPGRIDFAVDENHWIVPLLKVQDRVDLLVRNIVLGVPWTRVIRSFFMDWKYRPASGPGNRQLFATCPGQLEMLRWRPNAYPAGQSGTTSFSASPAESIGKDVAEANAGASAITPPRYENGVIPTFTTAPDLLRGPVLDRNYANGKTVIDILQDTAFADDSSWYFTELTPIQTWTLEYLPYNDPARDKTSVSFSMELGNMLDPVRALNYSNSRNVAIVAGQGREAGRTVAVVNNAPVGLISQEIWVNATRESTASGLTTRGDAVLFDKRPRDTLDFGATNTAFFWLSDWGVGDNVTVRYQGTDYIHRVRGVEVAVQRSGNAPYTITPVTGMTTT